MHVTVDDTLDSILGGEDDEDEEDAVISQVLDEIGIEVSSKVNNSSHCAYSYSIYIHTIWLYTLSGAIGQLGWGVVYCL